MWGTVILVLFGVHDTSLLCFCRNSISCCVNVVIEMDFTLCGGFSPRLWVEEVYVSREQERQDAAQRCSCDKK